MTMTVRPSASGFGAEITGIDLRQPLDAKGYEAIEDALSAHGVLCFRDQSIQDPHQEALIRWFGEPNAATAELNNAANTNPYFYDVSNVDETGGIMKPEHKRRLYLLANMFWHSDMSMRQPPARVTILSARVLPENPPNTEFADMRNAWEALPPERQAELIDLQIEHSVYASRARVGFTEFSEETRSKLPPVSHPLVRVHARSGRRSLYMGAHASHVIGWPVEQGKKLLDELVEFATQPRFRYVHHWRDGDVLMWDNSCTMHRATEFDDQKYRRELRWCSSREPAPV